MGGESIGPTADEARDGGRVAAQSVVALPADTAAPAIARSYLVEHAGGLPDELIDDAMLLVSELVTNAVQHGQPDIVLSIRHSPPGIGVSVRDAGDGVPAVPASAPDPGAPKGRGLRIVDALSSAWGVQPADPPPGKVVWFELADPHDSSR